ncbi:hypothetical protein M409DRAFT_23575 [Zasmidium cellare ATCC 36951]|uniref:Xylanolytic transcriptional activator regulatory domain-containing protein n=1 Tax=Zasmidium cellare ATCC 36951 TaxID=1080233 RepID=A0A6A6CGV2_ZASCE|nr:uncharacterized protein M409DRAFT_23575 [Zasmidium cellare ATCC 36951]KAF2166385.1 hypothetical protein M409DRAFT_23575 [Zasmidium cellare ATCC 36951]
MPRGANTSLPTATCTSDERSRLNLLEAQVNELAARLAQVESRAPSRSTISTVSRQDTQSSDRPPSSNSSTDSLSEYSSTSSDGQHSPTSSVSLPFALKFSVLDSKHRDPAPERTKAVWKHYVEVIDPLLKIVHLPSIQHLFLPQANELEDASQDARALKWAICFASSISQDISKAHSPKHTALGSLTKIYQHSFETCLAKVRFLATPTITSLQALTIYLTIGSKVLDQTYVWSLTAILVRLAYKLKLHHDPDPQDVPFQEAEYRRRLWWHICTLDALTAETNSTDPLIYERQTTTSFPASIQDTAFHHPPTHQPQRHAPDMFAPLLRFETTYYIRTILYSPTFAEENNFPPLSLEGKLSIIDSLQKTLEDKYFRHCICLSRSPVCTLAMLASKATVAGLTLKLFFLNQTPTTTPSSPGGRFAEQTLLASTSLLEARRALHSDPALAPWSFLFKPDKSVEFDAAEICLSTLATTRTRPAITSRAWSAVDGFFDARKSGSRQTHERAVEGSRGSARESSQSSRQSRRGRNKSLGSTRGADEDECCGSTFSTDGFES